MLNETYLLRHALERAHLEIPREHPRVKLPGTSTGPCLRIKLDEQAHVQAVEAVVKAEWPGLWTVMDGNQNSFPVVRVGDPLCEVSRDGGMWQKLGFDAEGKRSKKKKPSDDARLSVLFATLEERYQLPEKTNQLFLRLRDKAEELLLAADDESSESCVLREFVRRFREAAKNADRLFNEIGKRVLMDVKLARLDALDTAEVLLVGKGPLKVPGLPSKKAVVQLAFDLPDMTAFPRRLYSRQVREHVKKTLPMEKGTSKDRHRARVCAYTGKQQSLQVSPFPKVKLPILNKDFPLVAMFSAAACNRRYGLTDSFIVPVAKEVALHLQDALAWIVAEERKGKTWRGVASGQFEPSQGGKKERFDLLIVYVDGEPEISVNAANLFGTDETVQQKQFETDAKAVCDALDRIRRERPRSKLNIFLVRKASEGQAHVVVAESPSVEDILSAAEWWQQAAANVPTVILPFPGKKGGPAISAKPEVPHPDRVVRLLSEEWVTNGLRSNKVSSIGLGEVLDLMLDTSGKREPVARHMLDLTVRRLGPLLLGVFGAMYARKQDRLDKYHVKARQIGLRAVSTLGILLNAVGRRKEKYMSETAFLVGRLLSLADTLHREYCQQVRGGDIPPQLIGNALMPVAADNPKDAVDRLRERMMIYKAWADRGQGNEARLAKWAVARMGETCFQLSQLPLSPQTDQTFRAELFLGYMARPSTEKDTDDGNSA